MNTQTADMNTIPSAETPRSSPSIPTLKLHSAHSVGFATFFGTPIAGGYLLWSNAKQLGNPKAGRRVWVICSLAFLGLCAARIALAVAAPAFDESHGHSLTWALSILQCAGMIGVANTLQGAAIKDHQATGGKLASRWRGVGIGLLGLLVLLAIWLVAVAAIVAVGASVSVTPREAFTIPATGEVLTKDGATLDVRYESPITRNQAMALGRQLLDIGYPGKGYAGQVVAARSSGRTCLTFPLLDGAWAEPGVADAFRVIARQVAPSVGGLPVEVRLVSSSNVEKATFTVE